jgi:hypothetical protein
VRQNLKISLVKKYIIVFAAGIVMAAIVCTKNKPEARPSTEPATEKKWVVTTSIGLTYLFN